MLKNNKILKAQAGAAIGIAESLPYVLPAVVAALGLSQENKDKKYGSFTQSPPIESEINRPSSLAEQTWPLVKSYISNIPNNVSTTLDNVYSIIPQRRSLFTYTLPKTPAELRARETAEKQQYWNNKAAFYKQELAKNPILLPNGNVITAYNPDTRTLSGYKDSAIGDRIFIDKNLETREYLNPVYKDSKTGAYYEGYLDLTGDIPRVGKTENLMPYSIVPVETPEWMTESPTIRLRDIPVVFNKNYFDDVEDVEEFEQKTKDEDPKNEKDGPKETKRRKPRLENDDNDQDNYINEPIERWIRKHADKLNFFNKRKLQNVENVVYNKKTGDINWHATKLINRGITPTNTSQSPSLWGTRLKWGIGGGAGGAITYGIYSSRNNKPEEPYTPDGGFNYKEAVDNAVTAVDASKSQTNNTTNNTSSNKQFNIDDFEF